MQDTKLEVLGQVFVVHSILLKLHSKFFLRFLDSPEKDGRPAGTEWNLMHLVPVLTLIAGGGAFKYEWVSQIDDDGNGWSLVSSTSPMVSSVAQMRNAC